MYDAVDKLRTGEPSLPKERTVQEVTACRALRNLHNGLGCSSPARVCLAMEKEVILARLIPLHDERVEKERRGVVRWLRPQHQMPRFGDRVQQDDGAALDLAMADTESDDLPEWPEDAIEQLTALRTVMGDDPGDVEEIAGRFRGARRGTWRSTWRRLEVLGVVVRGQDGRWNVQGGVATASADVML